jgi:hypothetical protein
MSWLDPEDTHASLTITIFLVAVNHCLTSDCQVPLHSGGIVATATLWSRNFGCLFGIDSALLDTFYDTVKSLFAGATKDKS